MLFLFLEIVSAKTEHTNMKFENYPYERPDLEERKAAIVALVNQFENAASAAEQYQYILDMNKLRGDMNSMYSLASVRHSINTKDEFYEKEKHFFDTTMPELGEAINSYYKALVDSKFRTELEAKVGVHLFNMAELTLKSFDPVIVEDLKALNQLDTEYKKLKAQATIEFEGKTYNLSSIQPLEQSKDRTTRQKASQAKWDFYAGIADQMEEIYDKMVKLRHQMALKLGYENYVDLGYARMMRSDYNSDMVANFRKQVKEQIVPIASKLLQRQAKRLGLEKLMHYDEGFSFPTGNPLPKGDAAQLTAQASKMYAELSDETNEFFEFMTQRELMDLDGKDGKQTGGYCTFLSKFDSPFIFSNFNGTSHDITVLTHEAGHAFQCYSTSREGHLYDYLWPTFEACEIHSMSMEFFTWPWMELFFKEDTEKFKFSHLAGSILFLPYGCAIDEFQHVVYENPTMTIAERNAAWKAIEEKYLPHRDYGDNEYLNGGRFWQRQSHLFGMPFYYIDYVLAQTCAFQFWKRSLEDKDNAWQDYMTLCKAGGTKSFLDLVDLANLDSPFEDGCLEKVVAPIEAHLNSVDDSKF